jgi:cytochrome P450
MFRTHIDLLLFKLGEVAAANQPVDMAKLFNFTTFDIMGELTFGQSLGQLKAEAYTHWVKAVFDSIRAIPIAQLIQHYPMLQTLFNLVEPQSIKAMKYNHFQYSADRVDLRLARGSSKPDIWNLVLAAQGDQRLSLDEMYCHADVFMLAGSETTGTAMSGLTYYLLTNRDKLALLTREIRGRFASAEDITMESTAPLPYLNACKRAPLYSPCSPSQYEVNSSPPPRALPPSFPPHQPHHQTQHNTTQLATKTKQKKGIQEALRLYPPVPVGVPRVVTSPGKTVLGHFLPPDARVSVHHYASCRSAANFARPDEFAPERWLSASAFGSAGCAGGTGKEGGGGVADGGAGDASGAGGGGVFANDRREAMQVFGFGPRNCLGQNMAMHEMRLVLARVFFRFDLEVCEESRGWTEQRAFVLWEKKPLFCRLRPAAAAPAAPVWGV